MDAFAGLNRRWKQVRRSEAVFAYLRSSVVNGSRNRLRRLRVARDRRHTQFDPDAAGADHLAMIHVEHDAVVQALRTLPRRQREVLVLRYYDGASEAEIAAILGIGLGSVKTTPPAVCTRSGPARGNIMTTGELQRLERIGRLMEQALHEIDTRPVDLRPGRKRLGLAAQPAPSVETTPADPHRRVGDDLGPDRHAGVRRTARHDKACPHGPHPRSPFRLPGSRSASSPGRSPAVNRGPLPLPTRGLPGRRWNLQRGHRRGQRGRLHCDLPGALHARRPGTGCHEGWARCAMLFRRRPKPDLHASRARRPHRRCQIEPLFVSAGLTADLAGAKLHIEPLTAKH